MYKGNRLLGAGQAERADAACGAPFFGSSTPARDHAGPALPVSSKLDGTVRHPSTGVQRREGGRKVHEHLSPAGTT